MVLNANGVLGLSGPVGRRLTAVQKLAPIEGERRLFGSSGTPGFSSSQLAIPNFSSGQLPTTFSSQLPPTQAGSNSQMGIPSRLKAQIVSAGSFAGALPFTREILNGTSSGPTAFSNQLLLAQMASGGSSIMKHKPL